ncbi:MAG: hypothetical protein WCB46_09070 [Methanoregula sp.]
MVLDLFTRQALRYPVAFGYFIGFPHPACLPKLKLPAAWCCSADIKDIVSSIKTCWKPYSHINRAVLSTPMSVAIPQSRIVSSPPSAPGVRGHVERTVLLLGNRDV